METLETQPVDTPEESIPTFTVVVKVGGNELDDPTFLDALVLAIKAIQSDGHVPVIVHGGGKTIAHGFLTLSLVPRLSAAIWKIEHRSRGLNYGLDKLRFTGQVVEGKRVRLRQKLLAADDVKDDGIRLTFENTIDIEGEERPALVAVSLSIVYP